MVKTVTEKIMTKVIILLFNFIFLFALQVLGDDRQECEKNNYWKCERYEAAMMSQRKRSDAVNLLTSLCEKHLDSGCLLMSDRLRAEGEYKKAKGILQDACKFGSHRACTKITAQFTPWQSEEEIAKSMKRECSKNNLQECFFLTVGLESTRGMNGKDNKITATEKKYFEKACEGKIPGGCYFLARFWKQTNDKALTRKFLKKEKELQEEDCDKGSMCCFGVQVRQEDKMKSTVADLRSAGFWGDLFGFATREPVRSF